MIILGIGGTVSHDPAAALWVDGHIIAAAEEERFNRDKHAKHQFPVEAARFCLAQAGLKAHEIDKVALAFSPVPLSSAARWHYAKRYAYAPDRALIALLAGNRHYQRNLKKTKALLKAIGLADPDSVPIIPVEHHLAHLSSAYHLSGFQGKTALMSIDGKGEYASTVLAYAENGKIQPIKTFYDPDSLGGLYGALTEYLGFEMLDGEFKVMGMAVYGDPKRFDFSRLLKYDGRSFRVNTRYVNTVGLRRYKQNGKSYYFSKKLVDWLGPPRQGDEIDDPYIDYAASIQDLLESAVLSLVDHHLKEILVETGQLCYAGGVALNVKLNQRLMALPYVKELFVQPASGDAGTALGAATYVAAQLGGISKPMQHAYLGPAYSNAACIAACLQHPKKPKYTQLNNVVETAADLLIAGHPLAWFQGRMEFGPRALGNRSILADPSIKGIAETINTQIKYRERWRPFCPSILDTAAEEIIQTKHPAPFMTFTFDVAPGWHTRIPEVVHKDGTARAQVVRQADNPRYYALLQEMARRNGNPVLLNTSLNRRGEPMVCTPTDALEMFYGSDLPYLIMEDILIEK